jgi:hypothetical protein
MLAEETVAAVRLKALDAAWVGDVETPRRTRLVLVDATLHHPRERALPGAEKTGEHLHAGTYPDQAWDAWVDGVAEVERITVEGPSGVWRVRWEEKQLVVVHEHHVG